MENKQIFNIFLLIFFSFLVNNNSWGQSAYIEFGDFDKSCAGTGICAPPIPALDGVNQPDGYAEVKFAAPVITPTPGGGGTCTIIMYITKKGTISHLGKANRAYLRQASRGSLNKRKALNNTYTFNTNSPISIPTSIFGGQIAALGNTITIPGGYTTAYVHNPLLGLGSFSITLTGLTISNVTNAIHTR